MSRIVVFLASALSALFVLWLGSKLPETVASHFNVSGSPDSYLPRSTFVALFALLCSALPTFVWWLQVRAAAQGKAKIPNSQRWFSPAEKERTEQFLINHAAWLSSLLAVLLCYIFWLVFQANSLSSPLPMQAVFLGLLVFLLLTAVWLYALHARFGRKDA
jgi:uncharacterized membrane protein